MDKVNIGLWQRRKFMSCSLSPPPPSIPAMSPMNARWLRSAISDVPMFSEPISLESGHAQEQAYPPSVNSESINWPENRASGAGNRSSQAAYSGRRRGSLAALLSLENVVEELVLDLRNSVGAVDTMAMPGKRVLVVIGCRTHRRRMKQVVGFAESAVPPGPAQREFLYGYC